MIECVIENCMVQYSRRWFCEHLDDVIDVSRAFVHDASGGVAGAEHEGSTTNNDRG
jgi:hypothetical protein